MLTLIPRRSAIRFALALSLWLGQSPAVYGHYVDDRGDPEIPDEAFRIRRLGDPETPESSGIGDPHEPDEALRRRPGDLEAHRGASDSPGETKIRRVGDPEVPHGGPQSPQQLIDVHRLRSTLAAIVSHLRALAGAR